MLREVVRGGELAIGSTGQAGAGSAATGASTGHECVLGVLDRESEAIQTAALVLLDEGELLLDVVECLIELKGVLLVGDDNLLSSLGRPFTDGAWNDSHDELIRYEAYDDSNR